MASPSTTGGMAWGRLTLIDLPGTAVYIAALDKTYVYNRVLPLHRTAGHDPALTPALSTINTLQKT